MAAAASEELPAMTNEQLLIHLKEIESAAEEVLANKQEIVDLDRKRHQNREALRAIEKSCQNHWKGEDSKTWIAMGNSFFKLPSSKAKSMLQTGKSQRVIIAKLTKYFLTMNLSSIWHTKKLFTNISW